MGSNGNMEPPDLISLRLLEHLKEGMPILCQAFRLVDLINRIVASIADTFLLQPLILKFTDDRADDNLQISHVFGYITFNNEKALRDVIDGMNGQDLNGRNITMNGSLI
ncbi:hypothetical protein SADUNF_Sadunf08G0135200 [Salix dunnii]|uniref:RRM domain-containing protein n=1 Tax=Salix dunnii TaxID=1413687 RepID=A0A835MUZ1_9ROSI|nr:hypothetical protein SADUNF_Sadunf08G0135200 [Salix dunnii]